ncbi:PAS domain-containing sensor histidine kinase [Mucilaginibacter sp. ZT4R22]|uniref:histidine kinase n=1 Tax=Mucilaginibacter pankratovii TaxID=2772110 RepID=A0ABR7WUK5_9SPHI|nr:PAS domain-containing sensor histidine kinase [Mucilaginibacter pankratovii]MBD1365883.1 PAS domain-containing sensor histidine kinase [Mucilaginibacter pankratovii]
MPKPELMQNNFDEKLLQLLISRIGDYAIYMLDPNGYILSWNQGAKNIKGYQDEEVIGCHISIFYTTQERRENVPGNNLNDALKNNIHESQGWRVRKDGSIFWADVAITTLYDDDGFLKGFAKITRDITARKKKDDQKTLVNAELERRVKANTDKIIARERRFRELIENSYDGISLFGRYWNVLYRSRSAARISGWSNEERAGKRHDDLIHPDDLPMAKELFARVLTEPARPVMATYRTLHKQGHYIWIECLLNNLLNDPDVEAIVCNFRDVTGRILAEEQIREKNRQIGSILESITDGFIALDKNFCYTYVNHRIGEMLGVDAASLIGKCVWDVFPDAVNSSTHKAFKQAIEEQHYILNEDYYPPLGLWQENHIYPSPEGLSVFIRDITERKLAEASMQQSESNLRSVFENTDLAIVLFDMDARLQSFNNNARRLADRYFKAELKVGESAFYYCLPERVGDVKHILQKLRRRSPIVYEVSYPITAELTQWFEVRWVSVVNAQNQPVGIILTLKDITGKKQADQERDRMTADLIQRNKDLEQFTYIVSHNLRAPVANIKGLSDLLSDDMKPDDENMAALTALDTSVGNLDKVIIDLNHILQVSSQANDTLEKVSLPLLVDDVKSANSQLIQKNNVKIHCDFSEVGELTSLKSYLYSIFQNLIVNSIKYHRAGVEPVISIVSKIDHNKACLYFTDNGKGIDMQRDGLQLFGLYKRFDLSVEGKGMGLFMVKTQVERLGGKISVESGVDKGSTFKLEFPLK